MPQAQPAPDTCPQKRQLAEDIRTVMNQIIGTNASQLQAVIGGNFGKAESLEKQLVELRQWKDHALVQYKRHVTTHGC